MTLGLASLLAGVILSFDLISPLQGAVAVLYVTVVLTVAQADVRRWTAGSGAICAILTCLSFMVTHDRDPFASASVRLAVSLVAIAVTTLLSVLNSSAKSALDEQSRILELGHDTVIIRDDADRILHWTDAAERLYGWTEAQAVGVNCHQLLGTEFSGDDIAQSLARDGQWSGKIIRYHRDGSRIRLASSWFVRPDALGRRRGVVETSADITAEHDARVNAEKLEHRYATIFHAAGVAIWETDWSASRALLRKVIPVGANPGHYLASHPEIAIEAGHLGKLRDANEAAAALFDVADREDLVGHSLARYLTPEAEMTFQRILGGLLGGATMIEEETRFIGLSGRHVQVILRVTATEKEDAWSRILVMALDITERNENVRKLALMSDELAHAARISTLGQLVASIAHEVNQPLAAIMTNGNSAKRWMSRPTPDLAEVAACLDHIVVNATRAGAVISRTRSHATKRPREIQCLDLTETLEEAIDLVGRPLREGGITLRTVIEPGLGALSADRVQLQQVLVNLLMNAVQAMEGTAACGNEIQVSACRGPEGMIRIDISDNGTGIAADNPGRIFEPFFTTKREGMGMGLSICRTIIEAQAGKISAANNAERGATISISLPEANKNALIEGATHP